MDAEMLLANARALNAAGDPENVTLTDARIIAFLLDNCEITVPEDAVFFVRVNCDGIAGKILRARMAPVSEALRDDAVRAGAAARAFTGGPDFGHTAPLWGDILRLGLPGLLERVRMPAADPADPCFAEAETTALEAAIRFVRRAADAAQDAGKARMAQGLRQLAVRPPESLYEAMQTVLVYYTLQQYAEGTPVRTLGRLDRMFAPFYRGKEDDALLEDFLRALDAIRATANIPFMLCGSDEAGRDLTNAASYAILAAYIRLAPPNVKLHILCTPETPADFLETAMKGVKNGANSMVFLNDGVVIRALEKLGESPAAARDYSVVGCYECGGREETACTCNARVNLPKALELALHGGRDGLTGALLGEPCDTAYETFEALYAGFLRQLSRLMRQAMALTDSFEARYARLHASPFFTSTYPTCVAKGGDVYCRHTTPYPNSSINALGLATAVDSLAAVRKLVYEDGRMTLEELVGLLDADWEPDPVLRGLIQRKYPRYGIGDAQTDALAARIVRDLAGMIDRVPNAKGGVWRLGLFSIDWRLDFGAHTAASADGRRAGEPLSQNTGASFGADREGPTAHLLSVTAIDASDVPNGAVVDLDFHASAVQGSSGTALMCTALRTYLRRGGFAVHCNVLNTETLRDAMANPERYPNLQVRLCGWNVRFTELSADAQEEFIRRSESAAG